MARRLPDDMDLLPGMESAHAQIPPATPRAPRRTPAPKPTPLTRTRLISASVVLVLVVGLSLYAFQEVEQFLIRDERFAVARPDAPPDQFIQITGAQHASVRNIESVFSQDFGRSLYLVPLDERLAVIREVPWVRDASIARIWPNRLMVNVTERTPVAFVNMPGSRVALMDEDGVILPPAKDQFNLPLLTGVKNTDPLELRQHAVARLLRLTQDLGEAMKEVSEIDVSQPENIAISLPHDGRIVKLLLGDRDYSRRYETFLNHVGDIDARVPGATVMDLRLDDRITVVEAE